MTVQDLQNSVTTAQSQLTAVNNTLLVILGISNNLSPDADTGEITYNLNVVSTQLTDIQSKLDRMVTNLNS